MLLRRAPSRTETGAAALAALVGRASAHTDQIGEMLRVAAMFHAEQAEARLAVALIEAAAYEGGLRLRTY